MKKAQRNFLSTKKIISALILASIYFLPAQFIEAQTPKVQYSFNNKAASTDSILDETGNGYNAKLVGNARIKKLGKFSSLKIGATTGYVDLGAKMGRVISTLADFTISTYLYVDPSVILSNAGNFVWTFSNSADINTSATGCMFYTAKNSRYAICTTNWNTEKSVNVNSEATKGEWKHVTYTQSGNTGTVYIDGILKKTGNVTLLPGTLGSTSFNYLCKSAYASDQLLLNSMLCDFRIYNSALTPTQVAGLAVNKAALDTATFKDMVDSTLLTLSLGDVSAVTANLTLPTVGGNSTTIQWSSANQNVISNLGVVTRPVYGSGNATVVLTATVTKNFISRTKTFNVTVIPAYSNQYSVDTDAANIVISGNLTNLRSNLALSALGAEGSVISWNSDKANILSASGAIITRPAKGSGSAKVTLTATVSKGTAVATKSFTVYVAEDEGFAAYLFAYFTGNNIAQEAFRFALSNDGYVYNALNGNNPVISSASVSSSGGIRDPHILRGETANSYYMVATDMVSALGWNSNRAMILLKSNNLTDWTSTVINIPNTYPQYSAADRVWAPQTIYDPSVGKYMVYFAMRLGSTDYDKIYYAYANSSFTALESAPKLLFDNNGLSTIDADIVLKDGVYNLFFKTEGNGNGIKKAVCSTLTGTYVLYDKYLQSTTNAVEGGCVFRMYNTDNWILMYDMYTSGAYQFTTSTDLENFSVVSNTVSFDFTPRHGTIIPITAAEKQALNARWGTTEMSNLKSPSLSVYPNPTSDYLNVTFTESTTQNRSIRIFDFSGKKVFEKTSVSSSEKIDVSNFKSGIYLLNSTTGNGTVSSARFVVK